MSGVVVTSPSMGGDVQTPVYGSGEIDAELVDHRGVQRVFDPLDYDHLGVSTIPAELPLRLPH